MDVGNFNMPGGFAHIYNKDEVVIPPENAGKKTVFPILLRLKIRRPRRWSPEFWPKCNYRVLILK